MKTIEFENRGCTRALGWMDSFLDDELLVETNLEILAHLRGCGSCSREAESRRALRARLRAAARSVEAPAWLEARVRGSLNEGVNPCRSSRFWLPAAVAAMLAIGIGTAYQLGSLRLTAASQDSYIASVSSRVASVLRIGLADHIHCAVFRKYGTTPPSARKLEADLGPQFGGILPEVRKRIPAGFQPWIAHQCGYRGRRVVHLAFRNGSQVVSLVWALKREGEAFSADSLGAALTDSGIPIYRAGAQRFSIAAFETRDYFVYTVSDLPQRDNMNIMVALAPAMRTWLDALGS